MNARNLNHAELANVRGGQLGLNWDRKGFPIIRNPKPEEVVTPRDEYTGHTLDDFSDDDGGSGMGL